MSKFDRNLLIIVLLIIFGIPTAACLYQEACRRDLPNTCNPRLAAVDLIDVRPVEDIVRECSPPPESGPTVPAELGNV